MDNLSELKAMPIWVCWNKIEKNGRMTKVPCSAHGGKTGTNEEYRGTWVRYDEAIAAAQKYMYSGVGFVIPQGWFFLDIDHKELDDPFVQKILHRFDTYTEYSQSRSGLHLYGKCDFSRLPTEKIDGRLRLDRRFYTKNPGNDLELYIGGLTNRFAVFTGDVVADKAPADCTEAILQTLEKDMRREEKPAPAQPAATDKFTQLYKLGDISGYGSHSEADLALCIMLAKETKGDAAEMDRLFRASALHRDKWERRDYREATLRMALERYEEDTTPPDFIYEGKGGKLWVSAPLLAKHVRENMPYILVRDSGRQTMQVYVYENGCYRVYAPEMLKGAIKKFIADFNETFVTMRTLNEVYGLITTDLGYISQDSLNADEGVINFENGLLDISGEALVLKPHTPQVLSTIQIPCRWNDELECFKRITGGDSIFAEFKGQQGFEYTYSGLLWFCMNRLPKFGGDNGQWVYDRIIIVECNNVIAKDKQDKLLLDKMYAEREGIVHKCVIALLDVIKNGYSFTEPDCVMQARSEYMKDNNTVLAFFHECMVPRLNRQKDNCTASKLYEVYKAWCVDNNHGYAETAKVFRDTLCEYLGKSYSELTMHTDKGTYWCGYTLSLDAKQEYARIYGIDFLS